MHPARIAELLNPFLDSTHHRPLTPGDLQHISTYIDMLLRWNARINLTAIRDPEEIVTRHFGESLFAARNLFPRPSSVPALSQGEGFPLSPLAKDLAFATTVADLGSGAGFPGIPLKLWAPQISLTLIESNHKKATFLREVARSLTLTDINIQTARAETLVGLQFDVVTLRAVENFAAILPDAASLVAPAGSLALLIGTSQSEVARASLPYLSWNPSIPIPNSRSRILLIGNRSKAEP